MRDPGVARARDSDFERYALNWARVPPVRQRVLAGIASDRREDRPIGARKLV